MPELPEVETTLRGLVPLLKGRRLETVEVRIKQLRFPFPKNFAKRLTDATVTGFSRRAKYMLLALDSDETLLVHLGMSGRLVKADPASPLNKHDHVVITTDKGVQLRYHDPRRFGFMDLFATAARDDHKLLRDIGPEPLDADFSPAHLQTALRGKTAPIKNLLLDQKIVAGLGNIYVSEALFGAGVRPTRAGGKVTKAELERLVPAIQTVLQASIKAGGTSMRDYVQASGEMGHFQNEFAVYGREAGPCPTCETPVKRLVQGGRASFYCPTCQR